MLKHKHKNLIAPFHSVVKKVMRDVEKDATPIKLFDLVAGLKEEWKSLSQKCADAKLYTAVVAGCAWNQYQDFVHTYHI